LSYLINIDEGDACLINKIHLPFSLPPTVHFSIEPGNICDFEEVSLGVDQLEDELRKQGYRELSLQVDDFQYSHDRKYAVVNISGHLGKKVIYKVVEQSKIFLIDELFTEDDFSGVDLNIASPDVMKTELQKYYLSKGYEDAEV